MRTHLPRTLLLLALGGLLHACGGGGGGGTTTTPSNAITAVPSLGLIQQAEVVFYQADGTTVLGRRFTGADGTIRLNYSSTYEGPVVIKVLGGVNARYFDESLGHFQPFGPGQEMHAIVPSAKGTFAVTPLTEVAYQAAAQNGLLGGGQRISVEATNELNHRVRSALAPEIDDITTPPTLVTTGTTGLGDTPADRYAMRLAAYAELAQKNGTDLITLSQKMAADLADDEELNRSGSAADAPYGADFADELYGHLQTMATTYAGSELRARIQDPNELFDDVTNHIKTGDVTNSGGTALVPDGNGMALDGGNGITATLDGTAITYRNASYLAFPTQIAVFDAFEGESALTKWAIEGFEPRLGSQACGSGTELPNIRLFINGIAAAYQSEACEILVTKIGFDTIEGRFAARMQALSGDAAGSVFVVTDGYFRYRAVQNPTYDFGAVDDGLPLLQAAQGSYSAYVWRSTHPDQGVGAFTFSMQPSGAQGRVTGTPQSITTAEPYADSALAIAGDLTDIFAAGFLSPSGFTGGAYRFTFIDLLQEGRPTMTVFLHPNGLITGTYSDPDGSFDFTNNPNDRYGLTAPAELTELAGTYRAEGYFFVSGPLEFQVGADGAVSYTDPASCAIVTLPWDGNGDYLTRQGDGGMQLRIHDMAHERLAHFSYDQRGIWEFRIGEAAGTNIYRTTGASSGTFGDYGLSLCRAQQNDTTPPSISVPADITVNALDANGTPYNHYSLNGFMNGASGSDTLLDWSFPATITHDAPAILPLGTTEVTFTATDAAGNSASASARVTVADTQGPVITLPGSAVIPLAGPSGTPLSDSEVQALLAAVSASDNLDGGVAVQHNMPDPLPFGNTQVTFSAQDSAGNHSNATLVVSVQDLTGPLVTPPADTTVAALDASGTRLVASDVQAFLAGVDASDNRDGYAQLHISHDLSDPIALGGHTVTFTVTDRMGNETQASAQLTVADLTGPVVSLHGANPITLLQGSAFSDPGASAQDLIEGDVSASITVSGDVVDIHTLGSYTLVYSAQDSHGNVGNTTRTVVVTDTLPPPPWTRIAPPLPTNDFTRVIHTGSQFIAVGKGGLIATSANGRDWIQRTSPVSSDINDVIWDGNRAILVAGTPSAADEAGVLSTSSDGAQWSSPVTVSRYALYAIVQQGDSYLVSDRAATAYSSSDLNQWNTGGSSGSALKALAVDANGIAIGVAYNLLIGSPDAGTSWSYKMTLAGGLNDVATGNGTTLAVGDANLVRDYSSYYNTTQYTGANQPYANYTGVSWTGSQFLIASDKGSVYANGTGSWVRHDTGTSGYGQFTALAQGGGTTVVVGRYGEVLSSPDLTLWSEANPLPFKGSPQWFLYGNGRYLVIDTSGNSWSSTDLQSWAPLAPTVKADYYIADPSGFVGLRYMSSSTMNRYTSNDGESWSFTGTTSPNAVATGHTLVDGDLWLMPSYQGKIAYSTDRGVSWATASTGLSSSYYAIEKIDGQYIAVGQYGAIAVSGNGYSWSSRSSGTGQHLSGVASDGTTLIATAYSPSWSSATGYQSQFLTSQDGGATWSVSPHVGSRLWGITYVGNHWVAFSSEGSYAYASTDGTSWSPIGGFPRSGTYPTPSYRVGERVYRVGVSSTAVFNP